jgi:phosphatidylserine decarboxylase
MIEIVALMIGTVDQCYSETFYNRPSDVTEGMFLRKGQPKSLYRPGSSTTVVVFQPGRVAFSPDLVRNMARAGVRSRFSQGFGKPLVETDVRARSTIGMAVPPEDTSGGASYGQ